jgi:hypothetical protein
MTEKKQSYRERIETEEMLKFEMDSDNPFADGSYRSYKAKNRKKPTEKKEKNLVDGLDMSLEANQNLPF